MRPPLVRAGADRNPNKHPTDDPDTTPSSIHDKQVVKDLAEENFYMSCIDFINQVLCEFHFFVISSCDGEWTDVTELGPQHNHCGPSRTNLVPLESIPPCSMTSALYPPGARSILVRGWEFLCFTGTPHLSTLSLRSPQE